MALGPLRVIFLSIGTSRCAFASTDLYNIQRYLYINIELSLFVKHLGDLGVVEFLCFPPKFILNCVKFRYSLFINFKKKIGRWIVNEAVFMQTRQKYLISVRTSIRRYSVILIVIIQPTSICSHCFI